MLLLINLLPHYSSFLFHHLYIVYNHHILTESFSANTFPLIINHAKKYHQKNKFSASSFSNATKKEILLKDLRLLSKRYTTTIDKEEDNLGAFMCSARMSLTDHIFHDFTLERVRKYQKRYLKEREEFGYYGENNIMGTIKNFKVPLGEVTALETFKNSKSDTKLQPQTGNEYVKYIYRSNIKSSTQKIKNRQYRDNFVQKFIRHDKSGNKMFLTIPQAHRIICNDFNRANNAATILPRTKWNSLGIIHPELLTNLLITPFSYPNPLPVQQHSIPKILQGNNVVISSPTGSGKTLSFLVPLFQRVLTSKIRVGDNNMIKEKSGVKILIIVPGRELASQLVAVGKKLLKNTGTNILLVIGGTSLIRDKKRIKRIKPCIVIGTPGRIAELIAGKQENCTRKSRGILKLSQLQSIVMDECDALMGENIYQDVMSKILNVTDKYPFLQSILSSATMDFFLRKSCNSIASFSTKNYITSWIRNIRSNFTHVRIDDNDILLSTGSPITVSPSIIHGVVNIPHEQYKLEVFRKLVNTKPYPKHVLVFVNDARKVDFIIEKLAGINILAAPLQGRGAKEDRSYISQALREGRVGMVVSTELAARGIDTPYVSHVINYDLPTDVSHYVHRTGRCGRQGRPGVVVNIATGAKEFNIPKKFSSILNITMYTVEPRNGRLAIIDD